MQHCQIIVGFLFPADKEPTKAIGPRMRALNYPSSCLEARILLPLHYFLSAGLDVRPIMPPLKKLANVLRVVAFIEADVLTSATGRLRPVDRNAVEGFLQKFNVVRIRAAHFHAQRHAATIGEQRPLGSEFAPIGRVFPGFFPHPEATWSSLRRRFASSTECLVVRRTQVAPPSTACERRRPPPLVGNNGGGCSRTRILLEPPSTDSRSATHRRCRWQPFSNHNEVALPGGSLGNAATTAASVAKVHPGDAKRTASVSLPLESPPCWHKMSEKSLFVRSRFVKGSVLG